VGILGSLATSARPISPLTARAGVAGVIAFLLWLTALALPSGAIASDPVTNAISAAGAAQQMAQQVTGAALAQAPTAASITHVVTAAMAGETAPAPLKAVAAAAARVAPTRAITRSPRPHVGAWPQPPPRAQTVAPLDRHGSSAHVRHRSTSPITHARPAASAGLVQALARLAGDTGFLRAIARAGSQILSDPTSSSQIVANVINQIPGAAQASSRLTPTLFRDLALRRAAASDLKRRPGASRHPFEPPAVSVGGRPQPVLLSIPSPIVRPVVAGSHSRARSQSEPRDRPSIRRHLIAQPVEARPMLTLFAGGPALGASGAVASGAAAVALAVMLVLQLLLSLSTRLSLELVPWRSALLTLRLERPG
jgi:hypothetical protein